MPVVDGGRLVGVDSTRRPPAAPGGGRGAPTRRERGVDATLAGKVAAVTGAGSGIGRGIAAALADAGADVVANDVAPEGLDETLRLVRDAGRTVSHAWATCAAATDVQRIVDDATSAFGGLDIMVANAAVGLYATLRCCVVYGAAKAGLVAAARALAVELGGDGSGSQ